MPSAPKRVIIRDTTKNWAEVAITACDRSTRPILAELSPKPLVKRMASRCCRALVGDGEGEVAKRIGIRTSDDTLWNASSETESICKSVCGVNAREAIADDLFSSESSAVESEQFKFSN